MLPVLQPSSFASRAESGRLLQLVGAGSRPVPSSLFKKKSSTGTPYFKGDIERHRHRMIGNLTAPPGTTTLVTMAQNDKKNDWADVNAQVCVRGCQPGAVGVRRVGVPGWALCTCARAACSPGKALPACQAHVAGCQSSRVLRAGPAEPWATHPARAGAAPLTWPAWVLLPSRRSTTGPSVKGQGFGRDSGSGGSGIGRGALLAFGHRRPPTH